jgi:L-ribulose-5-phosphate 4-epimerase
MDKLARLRKEVLKANLLLPELGLVVSTQGNVSGFDRKQGLVLIKPSGVSYSRLKPSDLVTLNLAGEKICGENKPSVDWPHHLYLYRNIPGIGGVVHTHSPYATAFAAAGIPVSCLTTGQADVFGGAIPVTPYADNRTDNIGKEIVKAYRPGCPAIILGQHGVFAFDESPEKAVLAAKLTEYFAQINLFGLIIGKAAGRNVRPMPEAEIQKWYRRYHGGGYGQK